MNLKNNKKLLKTIHEYNVNYLIDNKWVVEKDKMSFTEIKKILLEESFADNYLGINGKIKRFSLPDFYFDLMIQIHSVESKLIQEKLLQPNHYLYQQIQKKNKVIELQDQTNFYTTLIYAQCNAAEHWNKSSELSKDVIDNLIFKEIIYNADNGYKILSKIFTQYQFEQAVKTSNTNPDKKMNLKEEILYKLYTCDSLFNINKFNNYSWGLKLLDKMHFEVDISKMFNMKNYHKIKYFNFTLSEFKEKGNIEVPYSFNKKDTHNLSLLTISKLNHFNDNILKLFKGDTKNALGLDFQPHEDIQSFVQEFIKDDVLLEFLPFFTKNKMNNAIDPHIKDLWTYVNLLLVVPDKDYTLKKKKI